MSTKLNPFMYTFKYPFYIAGMEHYEKKIQVGAKRRCSYLSNHHLK